MTGINLSHYKEIFKAGYFRRYWTGHSVSILGDSMARVALTWFVFEETRSAEALGWLTVAYTAPVFISGLLAGAILDRFDRRVVMLIAQLGGFHHPHTLPRWNGVCAWEGRGVLKLWLPKGLRTKELSQKVNFRD